MFIVLAIPSKGYTYLPGNAIYYGIPNRQKGFYSFLTKNRVRLIGKLAFSLAEEEYRKSAIGDYLEKLLSNREVTRNFSIS